MISKQELIFVFCLIMVLGCNKHKDVTEQDVDPPAFLSVSVDNLTTSSARMNWTVNENSSIKVNYGISTLYNAEKENNTLATSGSMELTGLSAGFTYYYQLTAKDSAGNIGLSSEKSFKTTSSSGSTITLSPPNADLHFGETVAFTGTAIGSDGTSHSADIDWFLYDENMTGVLDPLIGSIDKNKGETVVFSAGNTAGKAKLFAKYTLQGGAVMVGATASITVTP